MRHQPFPAGRRCGPAGTSGPGRGRRGDPGGRGALRPPAGPGPYPAGGCRPLPAADPARGQVRVRFTPSAIPVLSCTPTGHDAAVRGAAEALARLGRSDLGGSLEVSAAGDPRNLVAEHFAAGRAVENALHGGCGCVLLPSTHEIEEFR